MEMIIIFITKISLFFSFFFSTMLLVSSCASLHIHHLQQQQQQQQPPLLQNQVNAKKPMISQPTLPRKLIFTEQVKEHEGMYFAVQKEVKEKLSEKEGQNGSNGISKKQKMMMVDVDVDGNSKRGRRAKREEESEDPSQYFTMDYARVRRRRPIHNKHNFHLPP